MECCATARWAAKEGHLECLKRWPPSSHCKSQDDWKGEGVTALAAKHGHPDCLRYAHERGAPLVLKTSYMAAGGGSLACLRYLHEQRCPWDDKTAATAAKRGHLDCLRYAYAQGCPQTVWVAYMAAKHGRLDCLRFALDKHPPARWPLVTCFAALGGHLGCLAYVHERGLPWNKNAATWAAQHGHLACLRYIHEQGGPWDANVVVAAAAGGFLDCLRYAADHGCPWQEGICTILFEGCTGQDCQRCPSMTNERESAAPTLATIASFLGVEYIERHFTLDRSMYGADHASSIEPEGLRRLCRDVEQVGIVFGSSKIELQGDEKNPVPNLRTDV